MLRHRYSFIPEIIETYMALPSDILRVDPFKYLILLARAALILIVTQKLYVQFLTGYLKILTVSLSV